MKHRMRGFPRILLATLLMTLGSVTAHAIPILTGTWQGEWSNVSGSITADFDMRIVNQRSDGTFEGYFEWDCTSGIACSGTEFFAGGFIGDLLVIFETTALSDTVNIVFADYQAFVFPDGSYMFGTSGEGSGIWVAEHIPEPGTLALLALGLTALGFAARRKAT